MCVLCSCVCVCAHAQHFPPVDEADNGEVVCVKCVKGRAGSSSAVIHLYFRLSRGATGVSQGRGRKIHCRHQSHSYETTRRKCSASRSTRFSQQENKRIEMKSIICFISFVFLLHRWQCHGHKITGTVVCDVLASSAYVLKKKHTFVSDHSLEMWNRRNCYTSLQMCIHPLVSLFVWRNDRYRAGCETDTRTHTHQEERESENPCSCCLAIITEPKLCQQWVPDGAHHRRAMSLKQGGERKIKSGMWNREALPNVDDVSYKY